MTIEKLIPEDYAMIKYFWEEKGDITSWSDWYRKRHLFKEKNPELVQAVENLITAEGMLSAVVTALTLEYG